jgi:pectate lyase
MLKQNVKVILFSLVVLALTASAVFAADGWAGENGGTTGGAGGTTVTVSTAADFINYAMNSGQTPYIIQVSGNINLGSSNVRVRGNKTIIGLPGSHLSGNLKCFGSIESNNIFKNLDMDNKADVGDGDCISIDGVQHIWIDHCTFTDGGDGNIDIKNGSDYVTVSWCIFKYTYDSGHNFSNLIGHSDNNGSIDTGHLLVTFHHNWYSTLCKERMPRVRFGQVHLYNNYYDSAGNNYCIGVGNNCNIRVESNYFNSVTLPWKDYRTNGAGIIGWDTDNVFVGTTVPTWATNSYSTVFVPPYSYTTDDGLSVPGIVMAGAGASGGTLPPTNNPPTVSITSPANGATFTAPASVTINATAADSDGTVSKVDFYQGTTLLGTDTSSPYSYAWTNVAAGSYSLTAKATDNGGAATTSSTVNITVTAGGGVPAAPSSLVATGASRSIVLTWSDNSSNETGFKIERSTSATGTFSQKATVGANVKTWTDTGLTTGKSYWYRVRAYNTAGNSAYSNVATATAK